MKRPKRNYTGQKIVWWSQVARCIAETFGLKKPHGYYVVQGEVSSLSQYNEMREDEKSLWDIKSDQLWYLRSTGTWWYMFKAYRIT